MEPETKARDQSPKATMDQPARETAGVLKVKELEAEVVGGSEEKEASAAPFLAHPCSLLQLLLRAFAGCLDLRGYDCSDDSPKPTAVVDDLKPAADDDDDDDEEAAPAVAGTPQEGAGSGDNDEAASFLYPQEVGTRRVRRRRPSPPGTPGEGTGGGGGQHN